MSRSGEIRTRDACSCTETSSLKKPNLTSSTSVQIGSSAQSHRWHWVDGLRMLISVRYCAMTATGHNRTFDGTPEYGQTDLSGALSSRSDDPQHDDGEGMRPETDVPIDGRYLELYTRVSSRRFDAERATALRWCSEHPERLTRPFSDALEELSALDSLPSNSAAFIQDAAYADIAPNRTYSAAFDLATPSIGSSCTARL